MIDWEMLTKVRLDIPEQDRAEIEAFLDTLDDAIEEAPSGFLYAVMTKLVNEMSMRGMSVKIDTFIPNRDANDRSLN